MLRMLVSTFLRNVLAKAGTVITTLGWNSLRAMGMFLMYSNSVLPVGTVAIPPPRCMKV
ncbi:MAG: hypothetical protein BWY72_01568 [Bacteroidetes bacterium ADurb.Bin416]|nr:MAG: hypothetical protein BWY72_01568 [Bacteroidetes bacterium ADurb.Bin416]